MKKTQDKIKKWWEDSSKWYQKDAKIHTKAAHYGPYAPDEDKLRLLGKVKGKKILCGRGVADSARSARQPVAEGQMPVRGKPDIDTAGTKAQRLFQ